MMDINEIDKLLDKTADRIKHYKNILIDIKNENLNTLMNDFYTEDSYSFIVNIFKNSEEIGGSKISYHDMQKYIGELINTIFQKYFDNILVDVAQPNNHPSPLSIKSKENGHEIMRVDMRKKIFAKHFKPFSESEHDDRIKFIEEDIKHWKEQKDILMEDMDNVKNNKIDLLIRSLKVCRNPIHVFSTFKDFIYLLRNEDEIIKNLNNKVSNHEASIKDYEKRLNEVIESKERLQLESEEKSIIYESLKTFMTDIGYKEWEYKIY